jgi:alpha/beta superfamily hydrolase
VDSSFLSSIINQTDTMKKIYTLVSAFLFSQLVTAQVIIDCSSNRYDEEIFSSIDTTNNVVYGSNVDYQGANTTLTMDIYEPAGDTAAFRPLIVWVHGGSFVGGSKTDNDVVGLCQHFAMRGYVCVSIEYRLGITFPFTQATATKSVFRAVQDMKAAVRYFRQDAATANVYRIDPNMIFGGGSSAGAFTALHLAYLDEPSELPASIDTTVMGGIEGNSGNPGYPSNIGAVLNLCGAMGDTAWIKPGDIPLCSMHGTADQVVPYSTAMLYLLGSFPIMVVSGSYSANEHAMLIGNEQSMYTFYGADHVPYAGNVTYMDTTVRFVSNFLYRQMGCTPRDPFPVANTWNTVSVGDLLQDDNSLQVYPNPATNQFSVGSLQLALLTVGAAGLAKNQLDVFNSVGEKIYSAEFNQQITIDSKQFPKGIYFVRVSNSEKQMTRKLVIE